MITSLNGSWRNEDDRLRDEWRHPIQTLKFFEVAGTDIVVEIWPGRGWYSDIIAPFLAAEGGTLIAAHFDPAVSSDPARRAVLEQRIESYQERYSVDVVTFGTVRAAELSKQSSGIAPDGSVDVVLTFRNIHNWMARGDEEKAFRDAYKALRPGGVLGVVEHRLPPEAPFDAKSSNGYVHEAFVLKLAADAGFEFSASSEINANPLDTADHPFGVWTLPPVSRTSDGKGKQLDDTESRRYIEIGESDRMTLRFTKPPLALIGPQAIIRWEREIVGEC